MVDCKIIDKKKTLKHSRFQNDCDAKFSMGSFKMTFIALLVRGEALLTDLSCSVGLRRV